MSALTSLHRPIPITSLASRYGQLRPFQRKIALYGTVLELLNTLDFLTDEQRSHIMLRTQASGERLPMDLAWRRMKVLDKEIKTAILPKVKGLFEGGLGDGKTHEEICEMVLQSDYVSLIYSAFSMVFEEIGCVYIFPYNLMECVSLLS